jgi:prepilin-type N-terminal cleavage/methylation domain-containing protein/prepilin-type processing-associated H-X9-DG protein
MGKRGFSLVELLIVVAIIGLLSSILLPGLARAREYAYFARCKSNLRQVGIGLLIYAQDNRGSMRIIPTRCVSSPPNQNGNPGRKIGYFGTDDWTRGYQVGSSDGRHIIDKLYMDGGSPPDNNPDTFSSMNFKGRDWSDTNILNGWVGRPRRKGMYLTIEIMWDPIQKVRSWGMFGTGSFPYGYTGTEKERDELSRGGVTRAHGIVGYALFIHTVNCTAYLADRSQKGHLLPGFGGGSSVYHSEGPNHRPDTKNRSTSTSALPSVWLGVCQVPASSGSWRVFTSHFGVKSTAGGGFRFNVLHLDGHVDDSTWKDYPLYTGSWSLYMSNGGWDQKRRPYGWWTTSPSSLGYKEWPMCEGAFDQNAHECRRVER